MRSLDQERSHYAYTCVNDIKVYNHERNKEIQQKYNSYASSAPVLILTNGLGNTLAFYKSKIGDIKDMKNNPSKIAYNLLYTHISNWLSGKLSPKVNYTDGEDLLAWLLKKNVTTLNVAYATEEVLRFLNWIKRFADAILEKEESK